MNLCLITRATLNTSTVIIVQQPRKVMRID